MEIPKNISDKTSNKDLSLNKTQEIKGEVQNENIDIKEILKAVDDLQSSKNVSIHQLPNDVIDFDAAPVLYHSGNILMEDGNVVDSIETECELQPKQQKETKKLKERPKSVTEENHLGNFTEESYELWLEESYKTKPGIWYVESLDKVEEIIQNYQYRTMTKYCSYFSMKNFGSSSVGDRKHKIRWEADGFQFDFIPFVICCSKQMDCQFGKGRKNQSNLKARLKNPSQKRSYKSVDSKKLGCLATIKIKEAIKFPDFKINGNTEYKREVASRNVRNLIKNGKHIKLEKVFVLYLPSTKDHTEHTIGCDQVILKDKVNWDIVMQVQRYYLQHYRICEIQNLIKTYVENEMPDISNGPEAKKPKYNPNKNDITNICGTLQKLSKVGENLIKDVTKIIEEHDFSPLTSFYANETKVNLKQLLIDDDLNESKIDADKFNRKKQRSIETFLLIVQTHFQHRLMRKYNNHVYFIQINHDEAFRKLVPWDMYLMIVQTCCDFQVVCTVVCSRMRQNVLEEVFKSVKDMYGGLLPKYFFIDCSTTICEAFESIFTDVPYFYTEDSFIKFWSQFLNRPSNGLSSQKDEVLFFLNDMKKALTEESLALSATLFEASHVWESNEKLRTEFQQNWFASAKHWVVGYLPDEIQIINHFKDTISKACKHYSNEMANVYQAANGLKQLIENVCLKIPKLEEERHISNMNATFYDCKEAEKNISNYPQLLNIPEILRPFIYPLFDCLSKQTIEIKQDNRGSFVVKTDLIDVNNRYTADSGSDATLRTNNKEVECDLFSIETSYGRVNGEYFDTSCDSFTVDFGDNQSFPICSCQYWLQYKLPCLHMCAVFLKYPSYWNFDMLSCLYRMNSCFYFDYDILNLDKAKFYEPFSTARDHQLQKETKDLNLHLQTSLKIFQTNENFRTQQFDALEKSLTEVLQFLQEKRNNTNKLSITTESCISSLPTCVQVVVPPSQQQTIVRILERKNDHAELKESFSVLENTILKNKLKPPSFPANTRSLLTRSKRKRKLAPAPPRPNIVTSNQEIPSSQAQQDIVPSSQAQQDIVPSSQAQQDIVLSSEKQQDILSSSEKQDIVSSSQIQQDVVLSSQAQQDIVSSSEKQQGIVLSSQAQQDIVLSSEKQQDILSSSQTQQDLEDILPLNQ